jgi:hypothetical protein
VVENDVDTLRAIGSDDPYQILVRIPGGFEYTGPNSEAETALSKTLKVDGPGKIHYQHTDSHSSMAIVKHEGRLPAPA